MPHLRTSTNRVYLNMSELGLGMRLTSEARWQYVSTTLDHVSIVVEYGPVKQVSGILAPGLIAAMPTGQGPESELFPEGYAVRFC